MAGPEDLRFQRVVGLRLRQARKRIGITATEAGRRIGLDQPKMSRIEFGDRKATNLELRSLAEIYGVEIAVLLAPPTEQELATWLPRRII